MKRKHTFPIRHAALVGRSMYPTLHEGDLLEIAPYVNDRVCIGDVIFFMSPEGQRAVVHRVCHEGPKSIRTRGDNNTSYDPWAVQTQSIAGRVVAVWRGQRRLRIAGGRRGRLVAHAARSRRKLDQTISYLARPFYYRLARWCRSRELLRRICPLVRAVVFRANGRTHVRYMWRRRVVGRYDLHQRRGYLQRPFRLFVDKWPPVDVSNACP